MNPVTILDADDFELPDMDLRAQVNYRELLRRTAGGESLGSIAGDYLTDEYSMRLWISQHQKLDDLYRQARRFRSERYADEIVELADEAVRSDPRRVQAYKLAIETRKWLAERWHDQQYGTKVRQSITLQSHEDALRSLLADEPMYRPPVKRDGLADL